MKIKIQGCSNVTVIGKHTSKTCKSTYDIDDAKFYASVTDLADALNVSQGAASIALSKPNATCRGHRICFVSELLEYMEVINEVNRIRAEKAVAYDAIMAERRAKEEAEEAERRRKAEAQDRLEKHKAKVEELRRKLDEEMILMTYAESKLNEMNGND